MNLKDRVRIFVEETLDVLFPVRMGRRTAEENCNANLEETLLQLLDSNLLQSEIKNESVASAFVQQLKQLRITLLKDVTAIYQGDPAAKSQIEIILAYPGFLAIAAYRVAHWLQDKSVKLLPRMITEYAHGLTGIDIHPGAQIGEHLCIDHGTGIVIGETTIIGDHVKIYQGVTLGALSVENREMTEKRHPTIEDKVIIYAQAIILGGDTIIGHNSIIGGNVWLVHSVPPFSKVYYKNERTVNSNNKNLSK